MSDALAIYQTHLDQMSQALWALNYDAIEDLLTLPTRMIALDDHVVFDDVKSLRRAARDFRAFLEECGAEEYHRIAQRAVFHPDYSDRIDGSHDTYILRDGRYVLQPYLNHQVLVCEGGKWRGIEIRSEVRNAEHSCTAPDRQRQGQIA